MCQIDTRVTTTYAPTSTPSVANIIDQAVIVDDFDDISRPESEFYLVDPVVC